MSKGRYFQVEKNVTAVNILRTWLTHTGVKCSISKVPGFDLTVETRDGQNLQVQVALETIMERDGGVVVNAYDFTGKNNDAALEAFWKVTDKAGYDRKIPVDRGNDLDLNERGNPRKLYYKNSPFDVMIRHTEFRRSVNPTQVQWNRYKQAIESVVWWFYKGNYNMCTRNSVDIDDLLQIARCYVVNFCTRYEISTPIDHDNERKCHRYLKQRFKTDVPSILKKMEKSSVPDKEVVSLAFFGNPNANLEVVPEEEEESVDFDYIARNCELDLSSAGSRKKTAGQKLDSLLNAMGHDQLVATLENVALDNAFDYSARKESIRRLKAHIRCCDKCKETKTDRLNLHTRTRDIEEEQSN